jgi:mono/diheme cytochrome c family protein
LFGYSITVLILFSSLIAFSGCDYARMREQESVRTYEKEMPEMARGTVPVRDGFEMLKATESGSLKNPLPATAESLKQGRESYNYFCVHCHGPNGNGFATVGQSFSPLPTDLRSPTVQSQNDGELYLKIRLGFKRHPKLFTTVTDRDTWAVLNYMRSLKKGG